MNKEETLSCTQSPKLLASIQTRKNSINLSQLTQNLKFYQNKSSSDFANFQNHELEFEQFKQNWLSRKKRLSLSIPSLKLSNNDKNQKSLFDSTSSLKQDSNLASSENIKEPIQYISTQLDILQVKDMFLNCEEQYFIFQEQDFEFKYQTIQKIGEGAHSLVYKCKNILTEEIFAVKISSNIDQEMKDKLDNQYKLLKVLNHQNIIKVYQLIYNENLQKLYIISELCEYPDLKQEIIKIKSLQKQVLQKEVLELIQKVLKALQYVQNSGVCHRDIKPENILYNPTTKDIKLIDFDISKERFHTNDQFLMWTNIGSLHYRAPETFSAGYNEKVDVWSVGVILFQLLTRNLPFNSSYEFQTIKKIKSSKLDFSKIKCSLKTKILLEKMLQKEGKIRFSCQECLQIFQKKQNKFQKDDIHLLKAKKIAIQKKNYFQDQDIQKLSLVYRIKMEYLSWNITML